jgi:hypothetical protein
VYLFCFPINPTQNQIPPPTQQTLSDHFSLELECCFSDLSQAIERATHMQDLHVALHNYKQRVESSLFIVVEEDHNNNGPSSSSHVHIRSARKEVSVSVVVALTHCLA